LVSADVHNGHLWNNSVAPADSLCCLQLADFVASADGTTTRSTRSRSGPYARLSDRRMIGMLPSDTSVAANTAQGPTNTSSTEPTQGSTRPRTPFSTKWMPL